MSEHLSEIQAPAWKTTAVLPIHTDSPPLRVDEWGVVRVGEGRFRLDLVVEEYENGMSPEEMVLGYEVLNLADVYAVIAYYLRHKDEVRAYMKQREIEAEALRAKIEAERPPVPWDELIARRERTEVKDPIDAPIAL